jgi:hypothetical protein
MSTIHQTRTAREKPPRLPIAEKMRWAIEALSGAVNSVGTVRVQTRTVSERADEGAFDDDELRAVTPPTLDDIGRLWTFIRDARSYLKEAAGYLDDLEKDQLEDIDYVRVLLGRDRVSEGELRKGDDEAKQ